MHKIDIGLVEMTLDVMKYTIDRISNITPELGSPKKEEELFELIGETILPHRLQNHINIRFSGLRIDKTETRDGFIFRSSSPFSGSYQSQSALVIPVGPVPVIFRTPAFSSEEYYR